MFQSNNYKDRFDYISLCSGVKPITETLTIDDGTGKKFDYILTKNIEYKEYTIEPNFLVNPVEPSILDNSEITPTITDIYEVVGYEYKDDNHLDNSNDIVLLGPVEYNFYEDGIQTLKEENEIINQILSKPREQNISQTVKYFDGWKVNEKTITKTITKTNLPPQMCNDLTASGVCTPRHLFTTCSTDFEDIDPRDLVTNWKLYIDRNSYIDTVTDEDGKITKNVIYDLNNPNWELIYTKDNSVLLDWVYSEEGRYKINQLTTDTDGASSTLDRYENIIFEVCGENGNQATDNFFVSGEIEVEANTWQLCAIPMVYGYWDVVKHKIVKDINIRSTVQNTIIDQLEDMYNIDASSLIKVINAAEGDLGGQFYNFIPGFTKESSIHNFNLVVADTDDDLQDGKIKYEVLGFWIKSIHNSAFRIIWGTKE